MGSKIQYIVCYNDTGESGHRNMSAFLFADFYCSLRRFLPQTTKTSLNGGGGSESLPPLFGI